MKPATKGVLIGGGLCGDLDIVYAFVMSAQQAISPTRVLQSVASGWLGTQAFDGGHACRGAGPASPTMASCSLAAALYLVASRRFPVLRRPGGDLRASLRRRHVSVHELRRRAALRGAVRDSSTRPSKLAQGSAGAHVLVGLPIALAIRRFSPTEVTAMSDVAFQPMEGTCSCRGVRYRMTAAPLFVHCCHCTWCQRETGSAFVLNAMVEAECVEVLAGIAAGRRHAVEQRARSEDHALPQMLRRAVEQLPGRRRCDPLRARRHAR